MGDNDFNLGSHTLKIPLKLHSDNRSRLIQRLQKHPNITSNAVVLLQGGEEATRWSADVGPVFRQESYFHWAFGVLEEACYGAIKVSSGESVIFIPRLPAEYGTWMGHISSLEEIKKKYQVDCVYYTDEIAKVLDSIQVDKLLVLKGVNTDSQKTTLEANFEGIDKYNVDKDILHDEIAECRVIKSEDELKILAYTNEISSLAHRAVMKRIRPGMKEYQLEALFQYFVYFYGGCRHVSYTCICGSGNNGATLHYGHAGAPNDRHIKDGDMW